ncbi:peroxiredoxin [bacterium]|nr:peroxiredoxin [bacterium]
MENCLPLLGEMFPDMAAQTTKGPVTLPSDYKGKWFVLFSHPADFTPVCTTEFVGFQRRANEFREMNCELIGLSIDQVFSHMKWTEWIRQNLDVEIEFPIIADSEGKFARRLGLLHPGKGTNTVRAVFVVDPHGRVRLMLYYPQELGRNIDEILRIVKGLQVSDSNQVAIPANWPENDLIKDRVIIPPPTDEASAAKRKDQYEGYDWWFCHRELS